MSNAQAKQTNLCPSAIKLPSGKFMCKEPITEAKCGLTLVGGICPCPEPDKRQTCVWRYGRDQRTGKPIIPEDCSTKGCDSFGNTHRGKCGSFQSSVGLLEPPMGSELKPGSGANP